jgi:signal transduction histidine kinase
VVLSDVVMPGVDGLALTRALRQDPRAGAIPILLLSARGDEQATLAGLDCGADDYIVKPVSARELTARVRVHVELARARREAVEARERFMRMVVHELRTPLTVAKMYAQRGQARRTEGEVEAAFGKIGRGLERMERLVGDLADMARLERGTLVMEPRRLDLSELCREAADDVASAAVRRVEVELPPMPVFVEADPSRMIQVLDNLLGNAVKYSPRDQPIRLSLREDHGRALLAVSDRGPGVAGVDLGKVFDCYYQAGGPGAPPGLGMGLFICREIIERHGGSIRAESAPGQGLRVEVQLPLAS